MKHFCSFSEAIREGAKLRPQNFGGGMDEERTKTCAFVAACEAIVGTLDGPEFSHFNANVLYRYLIESNAECPTSPCTIEVPFCLMNIIFHLNDVHQWTREAIADWLESEEEKLGFVTISITNERSSLPSEADQLVVVGV